MIDAEQVYETLIGEMIDDQQIPGVENAFAEGSRCDQNYTRMLQSYERLCQRLNQQNEDTDVETIIDALLENQRIIALKMYEYGAKKSRS